MRRRINYGEHRNAESAVSAELDSLRVLCGLCVSNFHSVFQYKSIRPEWRQTAHTRAELPRFHVDISRNCVSFAWQQHLCNNRRNGTNFAMFIERNTTNNTFFGGP